MKKTNRISVIAFENAVKNSYEPTTTIVWEGLEITVKKSLSLEEVMLFADTVANSCFSSTDRKFMPEVYEFLMRRCVIDMYTNIALPAKTETCYELLCNSDVVEAVLDVINTRQYLEMCKAIDKKIDNFAQANVGLLQKQFNELYTAYASVQESLTKLLSGIDPADIAKISEAIANGKIDEEKIVKAYISSKEDTALNGGEN